MRNKPFRIPAKPALASWRGLARTRAQARITATSTRLANSPRMLSPITFRVLVFAQGMGGDQRASTIAPSAIIKPYAAKLACNGRRNLKRVVTSGAASRFRSIPTKPRIAWLSWIAF